MRVLVVHPAQPAPQPEIVLRGPCWVVDGDTIVIDKQPIRLAGIDAPELDHPWGQKAKWALVALCRGQVVTARLKPEMSYDRLVAECLLPDGRDLAAEMVRAGLALDWPKFSGGKYRHLEQPDARKKLWRANLRQRGVLWPEDDIVPGPVPPPPPVPVPRRVRYQYRNDRFRLFWIPGLLVVLVFIGSIVGRDAADSAGPAGTDISAAAGFVVTASALNVRERPGAGAGVIAQLPRGTSIVPRQISGAWYGIALSDGSMGWVHGDYLRRAGE